MTSANHLSSIVQLAQVDSDEERRALWRQAMATLARAAVEQQPVPLEGVDPSLLLEAVRAAFKSDLMNDLDWLSPPAAAAAVYELAAALPVGPERRQLGREVLTRLYEGDAETFVVLATSLAAESKRTLTGAPIRARVALALELPLGSGVPSDALALALISRPDLRREWVSDPAMGSLPSRRLAARLLERAARESARRAAQGDAGSLRAFQEPAVKTAWKQLLNDRESLVWRHVATARGLLMKAVHDFAEEVDAHLSPKLTPTEWRRAAVSLAASIAIDPVDGLKRCRDVLANETLRADTGLAETMVFGLARAAEAEPEAAEDLLEQIVRMGGIEAAEALVELRRERVGAEFGMRAARHAKDKLLKWLSTQRFEDDGRVALCEMLIEELSADNERTPTLRDRLDSALRAFAEKDARHAFSEAQSVFQAAIARMNELEGASENDQEGRRAGFRAMRELDVTLLETAALSDLLSIGASGKGATAAAAPLGDLFERLTNWLLRVEGKPVQSSGAVAHLTLRLRRMRTLLHLVDADGSYGEDVTGQRRERRMRTAKMLLGRTRNDAASPLRRIVCAALARALDALMRDEVCELSDVLVAVADNVPSAHDLATLAEASMMPDFQRSVSAYNDLVRITERPEPTGRSARAAIDALRELAQNLPWASTLRVSAMRGNLLTLSRELEDVASARALPELSEGAGRDFLVRLESTVFSLCQLTIGARRRLLPRTQRVTPMSGTALGALTMTVEKPTPETGAQLREVMATVASALTQELPLAIGKTVELILRRIEQLPAIPTLEIVSSFVPPAPKEAPLPPWLSARRTIGGFYVLHALGTGGVGSVFVVTRVEERHRDDAVRFALKVPNYNAEAARTLSEEEFLTLFRQEAGALLALPEHPNIATFVTFDAGARPKPILVMELVDGPSLERVIERGDLDVPRALHLLDGIAAGLEGMHQVGIGHLDVKPSNVILRASDNPFDDNITPVLVDFGLAGRQVRPGCATGQYGAPEIWGLVPDNYEPRPSGADVYAYSCLAYEILTGDTLFDGAGELATINMHLTHDGYPDKLLALRENKRLETLCDLIANGLRQHPAERISVHDMREAFREIGPPLQLFEWPLRGAA
ncbi:MAG TPA: serine/threonine-protein kinase [Polyangiales bacterium]|nr:serine/threonine-protein kinase [Polyangiales bacterium]